MASEYDDLALAIRLQANEQGIYNETTIQRLIEDATGTISDSRFQRAVETLMRIRSIIPESLINSDRSNAIANRYNREILGYGDIDVSNPFSILTSLANRRFEDVPVVLTDEAYKGLRTVKFGSLTEDEKEKSSCPICYDDFEDNDEINVLPCKHNFHPKCVKEWLTKYKHTCPVCKQSSGEHEAKT